MMIQGMGWLGGMHESNRIQLDCTTDRDRYSNFQNVTEHKYRDILIHMTVILEHAWSNSDGQLFVTEMHQLGLVFIPTNFIHDYG